MAVEDRMEHRCGEPPGIGVVTAAVIAVEERRPVWQCVPCAMGKRQRRTLQAQRLQRRVVRDAAQCKDGTARGQRGKIRRKVAVARANLRRRGLVVRRQAFDGIRDPAIDEFEPVIAVGPDRPRGEAVPMQCRVKENPGVVSRERPSAGIGAMASRRQPHDDERGVARTERRDRATEVRRRNRAHLVEERHQPRAAPAARVVCGGNRGFWQNAGSPQTVPVFSKPPTQYTNTIENPRHRARPRSSLAFRT